MRKIYPCITTLTKNNWRRQIADINKRRLKEAAVFLTGLPKLSDRRELGQLLKNSTIKYVPHVHVRNEMSPAEIRWWHHNFKTRQFNTHCSFFKYLNGYPYLKKCFVLETTHDFSEKLVDKVSGYCLDLAHLYDSDHWIIRSGLLTKVDLLIQKGVRPKSNHLSGVLTNGRHTHYLDGTANLDYLLKVPCDYFSKVICLEVENSIAEQLQFIKYINQHL